MKKLAFASTLALASSGMLALTVGCAAVAQEPTAVPTPAAATTAQGSMVDLVNNEGQPAGKIELKQAASGLLMVVEATGLTPGWHGIHLHATGKCETPFTSAGAHINHAQQTVPHGLLNPAGPDDGDLPNIFADANGVAKAELFTTRGRLGEGSPGQNLLDADGSAIIIHANPDDHTSQPIGGAGDRVACGVVKPN